MASSNCSVAQLVAAIETLAESFERAGRPDLATRCDQAGFWLEGGPGIQDIPVAKVVVACRETLVTERQGLGQAEWTAALLGRIADNLNRIETRVSGASDADEIELAARLEAVALLTERLF